MLEFLRNLQLFELARMTLLLGVLTSTAILRFCGINPGGILGAGFFVLALSNSPWWALALLLIAIVISWLYEQFFSGIYSGREPIFIMAAMSVVLSLVVGLLLTRYHIMNADTTDFAFGIILPAIVASAIRKQGLWLTYRYLALAIVLTFEAVVIAYAIGQYFGYDFNELVHLGASRETLELRWSSAYAFASVLVGILLYRKYRTKAAGFIILPMLATVAVISPINFGLIMLTAVIVYGVARLIQRYSLVIGTSRYALVSTLSVTLVWTITYLLLHHTKHFSPYMGTGLFTALAVTVLVNDHTIYGAGRTLPLFFFGLAIMACIEVGSAYSIAYFHHDGKSVRYYVLDEVKAAPTKPVYRN